MNAKQTLFQKIKDGTFALNTGDMIARKLGLSKKETSALYKMLDELTNEGLLCDSSFRYGPEEQFHALRGTVSGNERGFGFFVPDDPALSDLFLPRRSLKNALHGDRVLAIPVRGRSDDEGEVLKVLSHGAKELVGTFHRAGRGDGSFRPDDRRFPEIRVLSDKTLGCGNKQKAVLRLTSEAGRDPVGEITDILGNSGDFFVEEQALIRAHNLREEFPEDVLKEAEKAKKRPVSDFSGR